MNSEDLLYFLIALPFAGSALAAILPANARNTEAWLAGSVMIAAFIIAAGLYPFISEGEALRNEIEWLPGSGLNFTLRMDGFAWMFSMLITGIGFLVVLYARYYMSPETRFRVFSPFCWLSPVPCRGWSSRAT